MQFFNFIYLSIYRFSKDWQSDTYEEKKENRNKVENTRQRSEKEDWIDPDLPLTTEES